MYLLKLSISAIAFFTILVRAMSMLQLSNGEITLIIDHDVVLIDLRTGHFHNLTRSPAIESGFAWSPDGEQIAFVSDYNLYLMKEDGRHLRQTYTDEMIFPPVWSGQKIAFVQGAFQIAVMDAQTGELDSAPHLAVDFAPRWSADGKIYFLSNPNLEPYPTRPAKLYRMDEQTIEEIPLKGFTNNFSLSPDNRYIAYSQGGDGYSAIYIFDLLVKETRQLTTVGYRLVNPVWSPDSQEVAFVSSYSTFTILYIVDLKDKQQREIARFYSGGWSMDWSDDGLAFLANQSAPRPGQPLYPQLFVVNEDGSGLRQLTFSETEKSSVEWKP